MSVSLARAAILAKLTTDFPLTNWYAGRLMPYMVHHTATIGAVSSARTTNSPDSRQQQTHTIVVQLYLPCTPDPENMTVAKLVDPATVEDAVASIVSSLTAVQTGGASYWFIQPVGTEYPSDPNGQQTRAEITLAVFDSTPWL